MIALVILLLAWSTPAWADPKNYLPQSETPVAARCVNAAGTDYESCGGSGGDGTIVDGVSASIKATVKDYTNSNPLATVIVDTNGDPASLAGGTQYDQGTVATDTDKLTMVGCVRADTAAVATGVINADRARCIIDATGRLWTHVGTIDGGTITTITNPVAATQSGTWTVQPGNTANTTPWLATISQGGNSAVVTTTTPGASDAGLVVRNINPNNVAHDVADAGDPVKIGFKGTTSVSGQTMVANNDRTNAYAGIDGVQIVRPHANLEDRVNGVVGITDGSSTSVVAAQGAGIRFCATTIVVSNSSATNVTVDIRDGTAGSVLSTLPASANMGGAILNLQIPLCTTANTALAADPSSAASTVAVTAIGFKTKL